MEKLTACCITEQRGIDSSKIEFLENEFMPEIEELIEEEGCEVFWISMTSIIDEIFAGCVLLAKETFPQIELKVAIPYKALEDRLSEKCIDLLSKCAHIEYISEEYHRDSFLQTNRFMIQMSNWVIAAYDAESDSGTSFAMDYSLLMKKDLRAIKF